MEPTFEEIQASIRELYQKGSYGAALELANKNVTRFPERAPIFNYWMICMTASLDQGDESLHLLDKLLKTGFWYAEALLRKSPALSALQGQPGFEALVEQNLHNEKIDKSTLFPLLTIRPEGECTEDSTPCPLLIALHSNASTAQAALDFWKTTPNEGWLLALPQSSQPLWKDAYVWDDLEVSSEELRRHYRSLLQRYSVDQNRIILAGHNMGAEVAIWLALSGVLPAAGFIGIAPHGPFMTNLEKWASYIESAQYRLEDKNITFTGRILLGEEDHIASIDNIRGFMAILNTAGIPCKLTMIPGASHELSPEFETHLTKALEDIS